MSRIAGPNNMSKMRTRLVVFHTGWSIVRFKAWTCEYDRQETSLTLLSSKADSPNDDDDRRVKCRCWVRLNLGRSTCLGTPPPPPLFLPNSPEAFLECSSSLILVESDCFLDSTGENRRTAEKTPVDCVLGTGASNVVGRTCTSYGLNSTLDRFRWRARRSVSRSSILLAIAFR